MKPFRILLTVGLALGSVGVALAASEPGVLPLPVASVAVSEATDCLTSSHPAWANARPQALHFQAAPPIYSTDAHNSAEVPDATVQVLQLVDGVRVMRLCWGDATEDRADPPSRYADAGESHVYQEHSERIQAFADAACVMVPVKRGSHARYPSLMMGEKTAPMELYYWRAGEGFRLLQSEGRGTVRDAEATLAGRAVREPGGWCVFFVLPPLPEQTPVALALWDGAKEHRDGRKYFSLWYEVE